MAATTALLPAGALACAFFLVFPLAPAVTAVPPALGFHVGGPRGWRVPDDKTSYGWWASNNRFHVGDRLYFRYARDMDSVLLVDGPAFDACNTTEPLAVFNDGGTTFVLDRPGFFCFISGEPGHCTEGQKLIVRVMVHPALPAPGPVASAPGTPGQPGMPSGAATALAAAAGLAVAAALAVLVSLVLVLQ